MTDAQPNGYIRWRDLAETENRLRNEHTAVLDRHENAVRDRLEKAHKYHRELADSQNCSIKVLAERVDAVESVLDQQRGARNLVYALIGTNVLLAVSTALIIIGFFLS